MRAVQGRFLLFCNHNTSLHLLALTALYFTNVPFSFSTSCDTLLKPTTGTTRYIYRGNRCEGIYAAKRTSASLDLIGYTKGMLKYELDKDKNLNLAVPDDLRKLYPRVGIRAQPFSDKTYYRMDAAIDSTQSLDWPINDILRPKQLEYQKISVYGYAQPEKTSGQDKLKIYLPIVARNKNNPDQDNQLRLYFSTFTDINYLKSKWECRGQQPVVNISKEVRRSGKPILVFPPPQLKGLCHLHMTVKIKEGDSNDDSNIINTHLAIQLDR